MNANQTGLKKKHENKEQDKTEHETPRSKNNKATQHHNIRIISGPTLLTGR